MDKGKKKLPHTRLSFALTEDMKNELDRLALKSHIYTSDLVRKYVEQGLSISKSKDDIDFIRRQIREELHSCLDAYFNRLAKLLLKVGAMSVTMCYFTSKLFSVYILKNKDDKQYYEMLDNALKKSYGYLSIKDTGIDEACNKILRDEVSQ